MSDAFEEFAARLRADAEAMVRSRADRLTRDIAIAICRSRGIDPSAIAMRGPLLYLEPGPHGAVAVREPCVAWCLHTYTASAIIRILWPDGNIPRVWAPAEISEAVQYAAAVVNGHP